MMIVLIAAVCLIACSAGAICGIGGGVLIKPILDLFQAASVSSISFMSGCTVLAMSLYSVGQKVVSRSSHIQIRQTIPLAIGAAIGGLAGKQLFSTVSALFENSGIIGAIQSVCLFVLTAGTFWYTLKKDGIHSLHVHSFGISALIGLLLGICSSFLGIGGGPMNLAVLYFFFSMKTKEAAENSLCVILFSQTASFLSTVFSGSVPAFSWSLMIAMVAAGIAGGMIGRKFSDGMSGRQVERLFLMLLAAIMVICLVNTWKYLA